MSESPHTPELHETPDAWHRHTPDEGSPQQEHAATASPTALGITFVAMVFGVLFVIVLLTAYFNSYTDKFKAQRQEGVPESREEFEGKRTAAISRLGSYGWVDRASGKAFTPIDDAFDQVIRDYAAQQGVAAAPSIPEGVDGG